jgi:uncharacterized membrane protein YraQ (UPF0718 family)
MSQAAVVLNSIRSGSLDTPVKSTADKAMEEVVEPYAMLFFDHLYSEYLTLQENIKDVGTRQLLEGIYQRRLDCILTWSNIYTFDLVLVDFKSPEDLIRKAYEARNRYRNVAGQKEFDEYQASKPPDLAAIRIAPNENPPQPEQIIERSLRADIKYLLDKIYMYYALLPMREKLRERLTAKARKMTYFFVGMVTIIILFNVGGLLLTSYGFLAKFANLSVMFGLTVATVAIAGVLGGCVSMLQRIQSAPGEGDALFNLASLTNGWIGLSISPLYGAIFASLLFVLFSAGILKGTVFPEINTPGAKSEAPAVAAEANRAPSNPGDEKVSKTAADALPAAANSVKPAAAGNSVSGTVLEIKDFLRETGPTNGVSYGLLIIWSFIAGFAERLVPDTLIRMVAKNEAIQGTSN